MAIIVPDNYNYVSILAIDPGLNNTGVAHLLIDHAKNEIVSLEATTIVTNNLPNNTGLSLSIHTERKIKLHKLKNCIIGYIEHLKPSVMVCESSFYNPYMPTAYKALIESITAIQEALIETNNNIPFLMIEPLLIKKTVGGLKGIKGKSVIRDCIRNIDELYKLLGHNLDILDEHSIDAIAIGYTYFKLNSEN